MTEPGAHLQDLDLERAGDVAALHQIHDAVREHFGVHAQVVVILHGDRDAVRGGAVAENVERTPPRGGPLSHARSGLQVDSPAFPPLGFQHAE